MSDPAAVRVLRRSSGRLRLQLTDATGEPDGLEVALGALKGVREARVSPRTQNLLLTFDPAQIDEGAILAAVTTAAVGAGAPAALPPGRRARARPRSSPRRSDRPRDGTPPAPSPKGAVERSRIQARGATRPRPVRVSRPAARVQLSSSPPSAPPGWLSAEGSLALDASPRSCVEALIDFEDHPRWQAYVYAVTVLERDRRGRGVLVRTRGRVGDRDVDHVMRYRYPSPNRVCFEQVRGELEGLRGEWRFRGLGAGRSRATYLLQADPGWRLRLLLRGPLVEKGRRLLLEHTLGELRQRVEAPASSHRGSGGVPDLSSFLGRSSMNRRADSTG